MFETRHKFTKRQIC